MEVCQPAVWLLAGAADCWNSSSHWCLSRSLSGCSLSASAAPVSLPSDRGPIHKQTKQVIKYTTCTINDGTNIHSQYGLQTTDTGLSVTQHSDGNILLCTHYINYNSSLLQIGINKAIESLYTFSFNWLISSPWLFSKVCSLPTSSSRFCRHLCKCKQQSYLFLILNFYHSNYSNKIYITKI